MSRKVIVGLTLLVAAILVTVSIRVREGRGDDAERSVLVRPPTGSAGGSLSDQPVATNQKPAPRREANESRNGEAPRTASQSRLVDRLRQRSGGESPRGLEVPFRRPGGSRGSAADAGASTPAPLTDSITAGEVQRPPRTLSSPPTELKYAPPGGARRPTNSGAVAPPQQLPAVSQGAILRSPGPAIVVEAIGPKAIQLGKPATFRVSAVNNGNDPAMELHVRLELPATAQVLNHQPTIGDSQVVDNGDGTARVDWKIDELPGRGREQMEITLTPKDRSAMALKLEWAMRPRVAIAQIEVQEPQLDLNIVGPGAILYGQTDTYTITISNPGTGPAENVLLDVTPGGGPGESKRLGTIPAGGREVIKLELTAGEAGEMPILAMVRGDGGLAKEVRHNVIVRRAQLDVAVKGPGLKYAGAIASYEIRIRNRGDAPAENVESMVKLPAGSKYLAGLNNTQTEGQQMAWRVGTLQPGDERIYKVRCQLMMAGDNRVNVLASTSNNLQAQASAATRVEAIADLKLVVNDPQGPQQIGDEVEYEIMVLNRGTKSAQDVNVIAHFSEGVEPTGAEGASFELTTGQVLFKSIPRIGPGKTVLLKVRAKANRGGDLRFRAEVACNEPNTKLIAEETTRFFGDEASSATQP